MNAPIKFLRLLLFASLIFLAHQSITRIITVDDHFSMWAYGDAQMYNAGVNFANDGFLQHYFLPLTNPGNPHSLIENNGINGRYSHYPALHALLNGAIIGLCNKLNLNSNTLIKKILQITYFSLVVIGILLYYKTLKEYLNESIAACFCILFSFTPIITGYADSLCDQALNILLLPCFFLAFNSSVIRNTKFNLLLFISSFLISRNSIELIPIIFFFSITFLILLNIKSNKNYYQLIFLNIIIPIFLALSLQFFQSLLDFNSLDYFLRHWFNVSENKLGTGLSKDYFFSYLKITGNVENIFLLISLFVYYVFTTYISGSVYKKSFYFSVAIVIGFLSFPVIFTKQAMNMRGYSALYIYLPTLILGLNIISDNYSRFSILFNRECAGLSIGSIFFMVITSCLIFWWLFFSINLVRNGLSTLHLPLNVKDINELHDWGFFTSPDAVAKYTSPSLINEINSSTQRQDILLIRNVSGGASAGEVSPVIEFYLQRHAVNFKNESDLITICEKISSDTIRLRGLNFNIKEPNFYIIDTNELDNSRPYISKQFICSQLLTP